MKSQARKISRSNEQKSAEGNQLSATSCLSCPGRTILPVIQVPRDTKNDLEISYSKILVSHDRTYHYCDALAFETKTSDKFFFRVSVYISFSRWIPKNVGASCFQNITLLTWVYMYMPDTICNRMCHFCHDTISCHWVYMCIGCVSEYICACKCLFICLGTH